MEGRNNWKCDCGWTYPESIKAMKPVWRMNKGKDPEERVKGFAFADKEIYECLSGFPSNGYRWSFIGSGGDIYAYQTTRTREAKRK